MVWRHLQRKIASGNEYVPRGAATGCGDEFQVGETIEGFGEVKKSLLRLDQEIDKVLPRHNSRVLGGTAQRLHQRCAEKLLFFKRLIGQR